MHKKLNINKIASNVNGIRVLGRLLRVFEIIMLSVIMSDLIIMLIRRNCIETMLLLMVRKRVLRLKCLLFFMTHPGW